MKALCWYGARDVQVVDVEEPHVLNPRDAIVKETAKAGMTAFLPPLVPFGSKQWPALITPGPGPATLLQLP